MDPLKMSIQAAEKALSELAEIAKQMPPGVKFQIIALPGFSGPAPAGLTVKFIAQLENVCSEFLNLLVESRRAWLAARRAPEGEA
jgi:hypothetical protein